MWQWSLLIDTKVLDVQYCLKEEDGHKMGLQHHVDGLQLQIDKLCSFTVHKLIMIVTLTVAQNSSST